MCSLKKLVINLFFLAPCLVHGNSNSLGESLFGQIQSQHNRASELSKIAYQKFDITPDNALNIKPIKVEKNGPQIELTFSTHWKPGYLDNLLNFFRDTSDMYWEGENLEDLLSDQSWHNYDYACTQKLPSMSRYAVASSKHRNPKDVCPKSLYIYSTNGKPKFIAEYTSVGPFLNISPIKKGWGEDYMWEIKYLDKNMKILDRQCSMVNLASFGRVTNQRSDKGKSLWFVESSGNETYLNDITLNGLPAISQHRIKIDQPRFLSKVEEVEISLKYVERRKYCSDGYFIENGTFIDEN